MSTEPAAAQRFNMPFELGLAVGAKKFATRHRNDAIKIMVGEKYKLPAYLSDLGGNDPSAHEGKPDEVIRIVRNFLNPAPGGMVVPGPADLKASFARFNASLPELAKTIKFEPDEIGGFKSYTDYLWCITEFLKTA